MLFYCFQFSPRSFDFFFPFVKVFFLFNLTLQFNFFMPFNLFFILIFTLILLITIFYMIDLFLIFILWCLICLRKSFVVFLFVMLSIYICHAFDLMTSEQVRKVYAFFYNFIILHYFFKLIF